MRGLRDALRASEAATASVVAEAERRARHELLGEVKQTVSGHRMWSILNPRRPR